MESPPIGWLFILAVLGHFVGDYILQPVWMALGKTENGTRGFWICMLHSAIYAFAVAVTVGVFSGNPWVGNIWVWAMAFWTHLPIDRFSLGQKWLDLIGGRNIMTDWEKGRAWARAKGMDENHGGTIAVAFAALVYTVVDNTFHILLLLAGLQILRHFGLV